MHFSQKAEYGLRALAHLANVRGYGPVPVHRIAEREDIPERFLEQQVTAMRKAGLVHSQKGPRGGCTLARDPAEITIAEVLRALEGEILDSGPEPAKGARGSASLTAVWELWVRAQSSLSDFLETVTVADLARRTQELREECKPMYFI